MSNFTSRLKPFERRVRAVRCWRGFAIGASLGAASSAVWAFCDWRSYLYTEWSWMGILTLSAAILGAAAGLLLPIPARALAASIDRRAGLEDRLATAHEREEDSETFDSALRIDAEERLTSVSPRAIFPIRFDRWHATALLFAVLAAALFVLGNTPVMLSDDARKERAELKKQGEAVKRIVKETFETPDAKQEMSDAERRLADQLRRFDRDLEKAHMSKEDALQKANDLAKQADELAQQAAKESQEAVGQAETAREDLEKAELDKAGLSGVSMQSAQMSPGELSRHLDSLKQQHKALEDELERLRRELEEINKKLAEKNLSAAERKALEEKKADIEKRIAELEKELKANEDQQQAIKLSEEAQKVFQKMMQDPLYKQLQQLEEMLQQNSKQAGSGQARPKLTNEQLKEMQKALEELAKQLKDDKAMKAYLKALMDALLKAKKLGRSAGVGMQLPIPGFMEPPAGPGDTTPGIWHGDSGHIHKLDAPTASKGTTHEEVISGQQRDAVGPQQYIEIKAPTTVGNRSSVPYKEVLPSYERKAESAINRQQIPKEYQRRVKEYFDSLTGGKKSP